MLTAAISIDLNMMSLEEVDAALDRAFEACYDLPLEQIHTEGSLIYAGDQFVEYVQTSMLKK